MAPSNYRFGPFFVDGVGYRVLRDGTDLRVTPKLLDLLVYLLDHPGMLVTKEQLLDTLWPDANVTENALTQAVSELRQALGDDAAKPQFIKTVARRGYRFIATVERRGQPSPPGGDVPSATLSPTDLQMIAVMDFTNVTGDTECAWLSAGIAETVTADLRALGRFRVIDRGRVMEATRRTNGSPEAVAADLGVPLAVVGGYQLRGDRVRITARIVNVTTGDAVADAKVDGPLASIFELQDRVVVQLSRELGLRTAAVSGRTGSRETSSLEAYRSFTEGWLQLETLDVREIPRAIANFERAIQIDPGYALAFTGLASAQLAAYDATRSDNMPADHLLRAAIAHARRAVMLDDTLAEAHATLAFVLVSAWETTEAVVCARRAVSLEPTNWRHFFRLSHASWGDERLRAATNTLTLFPDFAFAHFQMAMVHVARGHLREAETVLRHGAAVQDRQIARGERYPALGLHWLLGLVRLAQDDVEEALQEVDRERELAEPHRLYGREYAMNALHTRGACLLRIGRHDEALDCFRGALDVYPDHARSHLGVSLALRATGFTESANAASSKVRAIVSDLMETRPIEAALIRSQLLASEGDVATAGEVLCTLLKNAPPGFAAWRVPVEPLFRQLIGTRDFAAALAHLAERAK